MTFHTTGSFNVHLTINALCIASNGLNYYVHPERQLNKNSLVFLLPRLKVHMKRFIIRKSTLEMGNNLSLIVYENFRIDKLNALSY